MARGTGMKRNAYVILLWKQKGKNPLGRSRSSAEDNIKMNLKDGREGCR
jgi:hypothetical protein